jgi:hypothetical protein
VKIKKSELYLSECKKNEPSNLPSAIVLGRGVHGDENELRLLDRLGDVRREEEVPATAFGNDFLETRLNCWVFIVFVDQMA